MTDRTSWVLDGPITSPFAHPRGIRGRLAGWVMAHGNARTSREVAARIPPGERVLEVGPGPGVLLRALADRSPVGIDPSAGMRAAARRRAPGAEVRDGTAAATGLPDASVDHVVSVHTVALWPDLDAGLDELHRVLRPGGSLLLAWHRARGMGLSTAAQARLSDALRARFVPVTRDDLRDAVLWTAVRPPGRPRSTGDAPAVRLS